MSMETPASPSSEPANASNLTVEAEVVDLADYDSQALNSELPALATHILTAEDQRGDWAIAFVLTTDAHLRELHRDFMGIDEETDVMTFPAGDERSDPRGGDIVISVDRAAEQATEAGHDTDSEIRFLAAHGLLHLCGWDDATDPEREAMHARQAELLADFKRSHSRK